MRFLETDLDGAWIVEPERLEDERGFFARTWCRREFEERGLESRLAQISVSFNPRRGTLRGMHWQAAPHAETKLVRVTRGAAWDVIVDLRAESPTFGEHFGARLDAENRHALHVPRGFAHGFLTLEPDTEVLYQMAEFHAPGHGVGLRWNDPALGIEWPEEVRMISERDRSWPDFDRERVAVPVGTARRGPVVEGVERKHEPEGERAGP